MAFCLQVEKPENLAKIFIFINRKIMEKLIKWYDLSTLPIDGLTLDMVPNYTDEMHKRKNILQNKMLNRIDTEAERIEYATLEFIKSADDFRDRIMLDWVISENEKPQVVIALQCLARANKLRFGIDKY